MVCRITVMLSCFYFEILAKNHISVESEISKIHGMACCVVVTSLGIVAKYQCLILSDCKQISSLLLVNFSSGFLMISGREEIN